MTSFKLDVDIRSNGYVHVYRDYPNEEVPILGGPWLIALPKLLAVQETEFWLEHQLTRIPISRQVITSLLESLGQKAGTIYTMFRLSTARVAMQLMAIPQIKGHKVFLVDDTYIIEDVINSPERNSQIVDLRFSREQKNLEERRENLLKLGWVTI